MNTLFIGGHADGTWHDLPDKEQFWRLRITEEQPYGSETFKVILPIRATLYRRRWFEIDTATFSLFVLDSMQTREAFDRLLAHYTPK